METNRKNIKFQLEGITCTGCAEDMENILRDKDGVSDVSVYYAEGTVHVEYEPGVIDEKSLFEAVRNLGFKTRIMPG
ncbi:MAG: heavy metal-associated domain-containing protein [Nitrospirota bacterium]